MADGKLVFDTKIDVSGLKKGLADVRAELSGMVNSNAYDNLKTAFEASQREVLNFRSAVSETFNDGVFRVSRLNEEQAIFYNDLQKGTESIKKQWDSVNDGFSLSERLLKRFRGALVTTGVGALAAGIGLLTSKMLELSKAVFGVEDATTKLSRTALLEQNRTIEESKDRAEQYAKGLKVLKDAQIELANYMNKDRSWKDSTLDFFAVSDSLNDVLSKYYELNKAVLQAGGIRRIDFLVNFSDEQRAAEYIKNTEQLAIAAQKNITNQTAKMTAGYDKLNKELEFANATLVSLAGEGKVGSAEWKEAQASYKKTADQIERIKNAVSGVTDFVHSEPAKQVEKWSTKIIDGVEGSKYQSRGLIGCLLFGQTGDGTEIVRQLDKIDEALQKNYNEQARLQGKKDEASRVALAGLKNESDNLEQQKESVAGYFDEYVNGIQAVGNAWSEFGAAIANGENPLTAFASSLKDSVASIIDLYADKTMAIAIAESVTPGGEALSAKAFVQYFALKSLAGFVRAAHYASGGVVKGTRSQGDNVPILATAGEIVLNAAQQRNIAGAMGTSVNVVIQNNAPDTSISAGQDDMGNVMVLVEQKVLETMTSPRGQRIIKSAGRGM